MSASRKKQERKAAEEPIISSRAQEEQAKEAQRKRNTLIYSIIGVVIAILIAILLIWNSGVIQRNAKVAEINGEKVTAAQVTYYYYNNDVMYSANLYNSYGIAGPYDTSVSPKEQVITAEAASEFGIPEEYVGQAYHDYFMDNALNSLGEEQILLAAAKEAGFTLSEDGKATFDSEMQSLDETLESYLTYYGADMTRTAYLQMVYGKSMSESKYRACLKNAILADEFYDAYFDTLTDYSAEELDAYYQENKDSLDTVTYYWRHFDGAVLEAKDENGNDVEPTEELKSAALASAQSAATAALAEVEGNLDEVKGNDNYTKVTSTLANVGSFYHDWLIDAERQPGDATVLESTTGTSYYVVVFGERYRSEKLPVDVRHILVEAKNEDDPATADVDESTATPTAETYAAAKEKAQNLLDQWKAGAATEDSFAALVADNSADPGSNTNGGLYEAIIENQMISSFNDWIFDSARQPGDVSEPIQNTQSNTKGWHLIYYIGETADSEPVWVTSARADIWFNSVRENLEIVRTDKLDSIID